MAENWQRSGDSLFERLKAACGTEWDEYCNHEFVQRLSNGSLPAECFRHYLQQDYLFLIHFARAWALGVFKADNLADMRAASSTVDMLLNHEMELHVKYCAGWGLTQEELERLPEARANMAYTRFVLERGLAGDVLDLHVALAPCVIGYAEIGRHWMRGSRTVLEGNPYRDWIEMYSAEKFQAAAQAAVDHLERLAAVRMGGGRFSRLVETFRQATVLEIGFWEMGLKLQT